MPPEQRKQFVGNAKVPKPQQALKHLLSGTYKDQKGIYQKLLDPNTVKQNKKAVQKQLENLELRLKNRLEAQSGALQGFEKISEQLKEAVESSGGMMSYPKELFLGTRTEQRSKQSQLLKQLKIAETTNRSIQKEVQALSSQKSQLEFALGELKHTQNKHRPEEAELGLFDPDGQTLKHALRFGMSPEVQNDFDKNQDALQLGVMERMRFHQQLSTTKLPEFEAGTTKGIQQAFQYLQKGDFEHFAHTKDHMIQESALQVIDRHPALQQGLSIAGEYARGIEHISKQFFAKQKGSGYENFVKDTRGRAEALQKLFEKGEAQVPQLRDIRKEIVKTLENKKLSVQAQDGLKQRLKVVDQVLNTFDPPVDKAKNRNNAKHIFEEIKKGSFDADTFGKWLVEDGIATGLSIGAAIAAVGVTMASGGTAAPFLAAAFYGSAAGLATHEIVKEVQYSLGTGDQSSKLGAWTRGKTDWDYQTGTAKELGFFNDVALPYLGELATGTLTSWASMRVGGVLAKQLSKVAGNAGEAVGFLRHNKQTLQSIAKHIQKLESKGVSKNKLASFFKEYVDEVGDEIAETAVQTALAEKLGKENKLLGALASIAVAGGKGISGFKAGYTRGKYGTIPELKFAHNESPTYIDDMAKKFKDNDCKVEKTNDTLVVQNPDGDRFIIRRQTAQEAETEGTLLYRLEKGLIAPEKAGMRELSQTEQENMIDDISERIEKNQSKRRLRQPKHRLLSSHPSTHGHQSLPSWLIAQIRYWWREHPGAQSTQVSRVYSNLGRRISTCQTSLAGTGKNASG